MEPFDINAGRFYLRALHEQSFFDDSATLAALTPPTSIHHAEEAESGWMEDRLYSWAVCEQTSPDLLALVTYRPDTGEVGAHAAGAPEKVWDQNRDLGPITLGQAAEAGRAAVSSTFPSS
ncbi:hypothetical protein L1O03_00640 [Corynebacterium uropygiale]|uniref:Uncharacterized protein n=1 Tax=Corynebacterium uropygiale TaxID=1775911 RepID=A0A9X1TZG0_9CORY|nr:hypothetical protein [Corynebacterium uropygiale]MCF4005689.1 hypothetical protein [Corynebacterium uropygiale]